MSARIVRSSGTKPRKGAAASSVEKRGALQFSASKLSLSRRTSVLKASLDTKPGAAATPMSPPRSTAPNILLYKVMGKMFAILSIRGIENVILKCDPHLAEIMREKYSGIGHRSHLDRRHWISVSLDADVPAKEVERLASHAYDLVCSGLTRKQNAELAALTS